MPPDPAPAPDPTEPGRYVSESGQIVTVFPPRGRFVGLWQRARAAFTDDELHDLLSLINSWRDANSTLVAYTNDDGEWVNVEPDWDTPKEWLDMNGC